MGSVNTNGEVVQATVDEFHDGMRLDLVLTSMTEDLSRSFLQRLVKDEQVRVNGRTCKRPSRTLRAGDRVEAALPPPKRIALEPQDLPVEILFEDEHVVVVNKASGMVVHPAPGHEGSTLVNALLFACKDFHAGAEGGDPLRPGIVHRLDQFTSGVMVVAKTPKAFASLAEQARNHAFGRQYLALVQGVFDEERGRIDAAIGRSVSDRKKMSVTGVRGRNAVTRFRVMERYGVASLLALDLETGRTHQIRVHLRFVGHPVLGDPVYGVVEFDSWPVSEKVKNALKALNGQALHAETLSFHHPASQDWLTFSAPVPQDFENARSALAAENR